MTPEQMQKIVDDAPETATYFSGGKYYEEWSHTGWVVSDGRQWVDCKKPSGVLISLDDLRTELAKREPMDLRGVDIPHGTIVLER